MKRPISLCLFLFVSLSSAAAQESQFSSEEQAVIARVQDYFWGRQNGDQERLARAFDLDNGHMKFVVPGENGDEVRTMSLADFRARLANPLDTANSGHILTLDVVDDQMAFVKFKIDAKAGGGFIDYLLLFKRDGEWSIVNKMFVRQ